MIDPSKPEAGQATTQSVRDNFQATIDEFLRVDAENALQDIDIAGLAGLISDNASDISDNAADILLRLLLTGGTITGNLTVEGNLAAETDLIIGLDDAIQRKIVRLGAAGALVVSGGSNAGLGGNIQLSGEAHASNAGDVRLRSGANSFLHWDEATGRLVFNTSTGGKVLALTIDENGLATFVNQVRTAQGAPIDDSDLARKDYVDDSIAAIPPPAGVEPGTSMLFVQDNAPLSWTKSTVHNNKALRIVSGAVGSGGTNAFTTVFGTGKVTATHQVTVAEMPAHDHGSAGDHGHTSAGVHNHNIQVRSGSTGGTSGVERQAQSASTTLTTRILDNGAHTHPNAGAHTHTSEGGGNGHSHDINTMDLQFVDVIIAVKD